MNPRPSTTAHPREDLHRFVNQLNVRYNVGVPIPDPNLTVLEKQADQSPAGRIFRRLETHFYIGGIQALNSLLRQFDDQAKEVWSRWVKKPDDDADTLPTATTPPLAANLTEREWLQATFNKVLDKAQPSVQSSRSFSRTLSGPAAIGRGVSPERISRPVTRATSQAPISRSNLKRRADADAGDVTKKIRADADPIRALTASSCLRRHQAADTSSNAFSTVRASRTEADIAAFATPNKLARSFVSASTGLSEPSAVFSACSDNPTGTQDTVEASSQEQWRPGPNDELASHSQDSYELTSSLEEGLRESFDHPSTLNVDHAPRSRPGNTTCSSRSSELASLSSDVEKKALSRASEREAHTHTQAQTQDQALSSIWRRCFLPYFCGYVDHSANQRQQYFLLGFRGHHSPLRGR